MLDTTHLLDVRDNDDRSELTVSALQGRYREAYQVARAVILAGTLAKYGGFMLAFSIAAFSLTLPEEGLTVAVLLLALALFGVTWAFGVALSCAGQMLLATVDTAVAVSPLFSERDKLSVMGISSTGL